MRRDLAREFGCDPEEIAITRNASEAMETLIFGIDLNRGDEVIITDQNYPRMITSWEQRARREGIVVKKISFPIPLRRPQTSSTAIREAITPADQGHRVPPHHQPLGADPAGPRRRPAGPGRRASRSSSTAPTPSPTSRSRATTWNATTSAAACTSGCWRRSARLPLRPQVEDQDDLADDGRRRRRSTRTSASTSRSARTRPPTTTPSRPPWPSTASIGADRKIARLRYLRDRWARPLLAADQRVKVWTPLGDDAASGGIALVQIEGIDTGKLDGHLWDKHRIVTRRSSTPQFEGVRVTPNVYTTLDEIDVFTNAVMKVLARGV